MNHRSQKVNVEHVAPWHRTNREDFPGTNLRPPLFTDVPAATSTPLRPCGLNKELQSFVSKVSVATAGGWERWRFQRGTQGF